MISPAYEYKVFLVKSLDERGLQVQHIISILHNAQIKSANIDTMGNSNETLILVMLHYTPVVQDTDITTAIIN
jgi:hypothetical protein